MYHTVAHLTHTHACRHTGSLSCGFLTTKNYSCLQKLNRVDLDATSLKASIVQDSQSWSRQKIQAVLFIQISDLRMGVMTETESYGIKAECNQCELLIEIPHEYGPGA